MKEQICQHFMPQVPAMCNASKVRAVGGCNKCTRFELDEEKLKTKLKSNQEQTKLIENALNEALKEVARLRKHEHTLMWEQRFLYDIQIKEN